MLEQFGGGALFTLVGISLVVLALYAFLEAWLLLKKRKPITGYVRDAVNAYPKSAAAVAFVVGLLGGHFWR